MAEKILNTRIALKIDTLENWGKSTLPLKKGELALATVAASAGTGLTEPVVMIKVGEDGVKTFKDLEWNVYAKASDVLSACKSEAGLTAFIKNVVAASDGDLAALTTRVKTAEDDIDALQLELDKADTGLKARMTAAEADIDAIEAKFGADTVALEIEAAIRALNLANTYAAKTHGHEMSEVNGLSAEFAKKVDKVTGKSLVADTEISRLANMSDGANKVEASATNGKIKIDGVETTVYTHPDKHAMTDITGLSDALAGKQNVIPANTYDAYGAAAAAEAAAKKHADDELGRLVGDTAVATQIENAFKNDDGSAKYALAADLVAEAETARAAEKANSDAIKILNGNAETAGSVDYKIAQKFATLMENPDDAMNSIKELVDWTTEHAADALEMGNQVTANKNAIATLNGDASTAGSVAKKIADAIAAENLGQYATDNELKGVDDRLKVVEGDINTATTGLKARMTQAETDINTLDGLIGGETVSKQITDVTNPLAARVVELEKVDHTHANKSELDLIASGDKAKWDAKLEGVTAAANSGLKATKAGNTVAIEIDDSITWIFDCGGAGV